VVKKALCLSEHAFEPHEKQLDRCTIAVAFLGTPHRGSGLAPFATGVAQILKAGGKRVNRDILQLLKRHSEVLADVEESFGIWLRKTGGRFKLTCFYEELELPTIGMVRSPCRKSLIGIFRIALTLCKVVTKESGKISGYPQISIHANHMVRIVTSSY
jgi:protein SERAC1